MEKRAVPALTESEQGYLQAMLGLVTAGESVFMTDVIEKNFRIGGAVMRVIRMWVRDLGKEPVEEDDGFWRRLGMARKEDRLAREKEERDFKRRKSARMVRVG